MNQIAYTPSFVGMPAASIGYIGLVSDAFAALPPHALGAEISLLAGGYGSIDEWVGSDTGLQWERISVNTADGRRGSWMAEESHGNLVHTLRVTPQATWSKIVRWMSEHGFDDVPLEKRTAAFLPSDVRASVERARAGLSGRYGSAAIDDIARELNASWDHNAIPELPSGENISECQGQIVELMKSFQLKHMPRLTAILDVLICDVLTRGMDPFACIAAHGPTDITSILHLLDAGFIVVSREIGVVHGMMLKDFPELRRYIHEGRLILSPIHAPHPNLPYSFVEWASPYYPTRGWLDGRFPPVTKDTLIDNAAKGALILVQTDCPDGFIDPFRTSHGGFRLAWERGGITASNYLIPSTQVLVEKSRAALLRGEF